jgi:hypothetical protein
VPWGSGLGLPPHKGPLVRYASCLHADRRGPPREVPPHEGLPNWASMGLPLLVEVDGRLELPRSRWTGIPWNPVHEHNPTLYSMLQLGFRIGVFALLV